jgi:hypothetical protein
VSGTSIPAKTHVLLYSFCDDIIFDKMTLQPLQGYPRCTTSRRVRSFRNSHNGSCFPRLSHVGRILTRAARPILK